MAPVNSSMRIGVYLSCNVACPSSVHATVSAKTVTIARRTELPFRDALQPSSLRVQGVARKAPAHDARKSISPATPQTRS